MTTVKTTDLPDYCFSDSGDLFVEGLMVHLGTAMRFRLAGKTVKQFKNNPQSNDDGYRQVSQAGWAEMEEGGDYAVISLYVELQDDHQSDLYPSMAAAAKSWFDGEIPVAYKKAA